MLSSSSLLLFWVCWLSKSCLYDTIFAHGDSLPEFPDFFCFFVPIPCQHVVIVLHFLWWRWWLPYRNHSSIFGFLVCRMWGSAHRRIFILFIRREYSLCPCTVANGIYTLSSFGLSDSKNGSSWIRLTLTHTFIAVDGFLDELEVEV